MAFLAHRDEIRVALRDGWPRAAVHGRMRGVLGISYQQFVRYVERYVADAPHGTTIGGLAARPSLATVTVPPQRAPVPSSIPSAPSPALQRVVEPVAPALAGALPRFSYRPGQAPRDKLV